MLVFRAGLGFVRGEPFLSRYERRLNTLIDRQVGVQDAFDGASA